MARDFGEVTNIRKTFTIELKKRWKRLTFWISIAVLWDLCLLYFAPRSLFAPDSDIGFLFLLVPWIGIATWITILFTHIRTAFWEELAKTYGWKYDVRKIIPQEKALVFSLGHSRYLLHGISGTHRDHPIHLFEYQYSIGHGRGERRYIFTIFEIKFSGTFPHVYLNYKKDMHSNPPRGKSLAKISIPTTFENIFDFYSPKEYEIEVLQIFTPDVCVHLIDAGWRHDMEFVDGEVVIYRKARFNSFTELDAELQRVKHFIDILSPVLNRLKLTPIGDISPLLSP